MVYDEEWKREVEVLMLMLQETASLPRRKKEQTIYGGEGCGRERVLLEVI
jgi:hypothetical protein